MLKRDITYEDYDGNTVTEEFHFNLSKAELVVLEAEYGGAKEFFTRITEGEDAPAVLKEIKKLILLAYGVREGNRFIKSDQLSEEFTQTPAYSELFMDLISDEEKAAEFVNGVMPSDLLEEVRKEREAEEAKKSNVFDTSRLNEAPAVPPYQPPPLLAPQPPNHTVDL